jgi:hypothetical protein
LLEEEFIELQPPITVEQAYNQLYPIYSSVLIKVLNDIGKRGQTGRRKPAKTEKKK